ncbi:MAG: L-2-hydroxyglutarate oxidase [Haloarculaceae archaeon]
MPTYDVVVVGAGVMGASVARHLALETEYTVAVLDKEQHLARHQSGRSSGVVHPGFMVSPGTQEAAIAPEGARRLVEYCRAHDVPMHLGGEVRIATDADSESRVRELHENGAAHGVETTVLTSAEAIREHEPHAAGELALHCPTNGTVDFVALTNALALEAREAGAAFFMGYEVQGLERTDAGFDVRTDKGRFDARYLVNAAGVHADRFAHELGIAEGKRIIPYRGVFYELVPEKRHLVNSNIYPVSDPHNPIGTGIHFTRRPDDKVIVGPSFSLAPAREGYDRDDFSMTDVLGAIDHEGFRAYLQREEALAWELDQLREAHTKSRFVAAAQRLVPEVRADDLVESYTGVIVRVMNHDGSWADMQVFEHGERSSHLLAVLPGITSSVTIGERIADVVVERLGSGE